MIDVVDRTVAVTNINQHLHDRQDVFLVQRTEPFGTLTRQTPVELHPANGRQIVAIWLEKQIVEQILSRFLGRWLTRAHHAVDFNLRFELSTCGIDAQGVGYIRSAIKIVDVKYFDLLDTSAVNLFDQLRCQFAIGFGHQLTRFGISYVMEQYFADQVFGRDFKLLDLGVFKFAYMARGNSATRLNNNCFTRLDIKCCGFAP